MEEPNFFEPLTQANEAKTLNHECRKEDNSDDEALTNRMGLETILAKSYSKITVYVKKPN